MSALLRIKGGSERYPALTGIRAAGATVVFLDHFPFQPSAHVTINVMAFFYALSGFLIFRIYYEQAQCSLRWLSKYFANRFARIYPVYFLLLSVAVCLQHDLTPWQLIQNYTLTHALFHPSRLIVQPSWSLTVEECFYFLAPAFMLLVRRRGFAAAFGLAAALLAAALAVSKLPTAFLHTPAFVLSTTFFGHFVEFFAGVFLALAVMRLERRGGLAVSGRRLTVTGLAGVALLVIAMVAVYHRVPLDTRAVVLINNFLIPVPIALLYWGVLREQTMLARMLASPFAGLLGRSSYSFYLLHTLVIDYVSIPWLLPVLRSRAACVVITLIATWAAAVLLFLVFEEPLNLFIRRILKSKDKSVGMQETLFQTRS